MSAYTPPFVKPLVQSQDSFQASIAISPTKISQHEPLMAQTEVMLTVAGDIVVGPYQVINLALTFT